MRKIPIYFFSILFTFYLNGDLRRSKISYEEFARETSEIDSIFKKENETFLKQISFIDSLFQRKEFEQANKEIILIKERVSLKCINLKNSTCEFLNVRINVLEGKQEFYKDNYQVAESLFRAAFESDFGIYFDPSVLYFRGYIFFVKGMFNEALRDFLLFVKISDSDQKRKYYFEAMSLIGISYNKLGDFYFAEKYFNELKIAYKRLGANDLSGHALFLNRYAIFLRRKDIKKSIALSQDAIEILFNKKDKNIIDSLNISAFFFNLGMTHSKIGNHNNSIKYYKKDISILSQTGYDSSNYIANTYKSLGLTYQNLGDFKQAIEYEQKALEIFVNEADNYRIPGCYHNIAWIYDENGYYQKAMKYHQEALKLAIPQFSPESLFDVPALERIKGRQEAIMMYVAYKGKTLWNLYERTSDVSYLHAALAHYQLVSELTDQIRASFEADESKMNLGKTTTEYFEQAVKVCKELFDLTCDLKHASKALQFAEKSKSLTLYEAVRANQIKRFSDFPAKVLEKEQSFRQRIIELEEVLYKNSIESSNSIKNGRYLNSELIKVYQAYSDYQDSIKLKYPQYYNLKLNSDSMDIKSIQSTIDNESTVLSYFMGKNQIYGFLINAESFELVEIPLDFPLSQWVDDFQVNMKEYKDRKEAFKKVYIDLGYKLYDRLLKPFKGQMKHKLTIVPHDILSLVSFDALLTDNDSSLVKTPYFYYPFVLYHHNIDYTFSLSLRQLLLNQKNASAKKKKVLAMAPTFYVKDPSRWKADPLAKRGYLDKLSPLIFNGDEVREIKRIWPSKAFIGKNANKHNFFNNASDYQIIHLATHGVVNNEAPSYSFVAFSQLKDSMDYDEVLFVNDLYNIQLNADLVVLSACETGIGPLESGEGMISIGRAFMYAGAKNIVMTLWNIDDNRAHRLMRHFYRALRVEENVKDALYQAKLSFLRYADVNSHPGFWAPFISIGDRSKIEYEAASWW